MQQTSVNERYALRDSLGSGGMGEVFLAHDNVLDRDVALKTLHERYAKNKELVERFEREARSAAALNHPNVVPVYDRGKTGDGSYYTAMEYVPGGTLRDRILKEGALPPKTATRVALQIAEALGAAHRAGIVHRDIKPQNILITESGDAKLTDFGIAQAADATGTQTGMVPGTAHYVSPEQAMGEPPQPRSDLYSLGVVLYEMLTGELPYDADTPISVATKHVTEPPRSPREVNPEVPEELNAIVVGLLAKKPEERYADADELIGDLQRVRSTLFPTATEETGESPAVAEVADGRELPATAGWTGLGGLRDGIRRHKVLSGVAALLAVVVLINVVGRIVSPGFGVQVFGRGGAIQSAVDGASGAFHKARQTFGTEAGVPDLAGMDPSGAKGALERAGLKLGEQKKAPSRTVPVGQIIEQNPRAGSTVTPGTPVNITVSSGPEKAADPGGKAGDENGSNSIASDGRGKEANGGGKPGNESGGSTSGASSGVDSKKDTHAGAQASASEAPKGSGAAPNAASATTAPSSKTAPAAPASGSTPATTTTTTPASGSNGYSSYGGGSGYDSGSGSGGNSGYDGGSNGGSGYGSGSNTGGSGYGGSDSSYGSASASDSAPTSGSTPAATTTPTSGSNGGSGYGSGSNGSGGSGYGSGSGGGSNYSGSSGYGSGSGYDSSSGGGGGGSSYGGGNSSGYESGSNGGSGYGSDSERGFSSGGGSGYGNDSNPSPSSGGSTEGSGYGNGGSGGSGGGNGYGSS